MVNKKKFKLNSDIHHINTKHKCNFHQPSANLSLNQKGLYSTVTKESTDSYISEEKYCNVNKQFPPLLCSLSPLGTNIVISTLFTNTLSLRSSLNVGDQVSHPYKTTGRIIDLYILIFKLLDSKLEDKRFCTE